MSRIDNPTRGELDELLKRVKALERATPLASASMGRGRLRLYDGSELLIEDGNLTISGVATIDGQLIGSGTLEWTGPVDVTGDTTLGGDTEIDGKTTLKNDLTVGSGGKIIIGAMVLDPAVSGAGGVGGVTATVAILLDAPTVVVQESLQVNNNLNAAGGVTLTNLPTISGVQPNLYVDVNDFHKVKIIL